LILGLDSCWRAKNQRESPISGPLQ
jgi:hypothetical protein